MTLVKDAADWAAIKPHLLKKFNIFHGTVRGSPIEFPCLAKFIPISDNNGYGVNVICFYTEDAKKLLEYNGIDVKVE